MAALCIHPCPTLPLSIAEDFAEVVTYISVRGAGVLKGSLVLFQQLRSDSLREALLPGAEKAQQSTLVGSKGGNTTWEIDHAFLSLGSRQRAENCLDEESGAQALGKSSIDS